MNWYEIEVEACYQLRGQELKDWRKEREQGMPEIPGIPGVSLSEGKSQTSSEYPLRYMWERGSLSGNAIDKMLLFNVIEKGAKLLLTWPEKQVIVKYDEGLVDFILTHKHQKQKDG